MRLRLDWFAGRRCAAAVAGLAVFAGWSGTAGASETIQYVYDARGRLVEVERVQPTVTVKTKYSYDKADNRTKKEVTTTP